MCFEASHFSCCLTQLTRFLLFRCHLLTQPQPPQQQQEKKSVISPFEPRNKPSYFPSRILVGYQGPLLDNGSPEFLHNWVVFHPLPTPSMYGIFTYMNG